MSDIRFNRWLHQSGTGGVYQDSTGSVGIGTSVPTSLVDIQSGNLKIGNQIITATGVSTFTSGLNVTGGRVGIGTDNPPKSLSILSSQSVMLELEGTTDTARIGFKVPNTTFVPTIGVSNEEDIQFRVGGSERVRIDSSGRILVGTATTIGNGADHRDTLTLVSASGGGLLFGRNDSTAIAGNNLGKLEFWGNDDNGVYQLCASIVAEADGSHAPDDKPSRLSFRTSQGGSVGADEVMRIAASGQVRILANTQNAFRVGTVDGTTFESGYENNIVIYGESATDFTLIRGCNTADGTPVFDAQVNGTRSIEIEADGDIYNLSQTYGQISDAKLKENIVDASSQWDDIKALRVRNFNFREDLGYNPKTQIGFVAQEVEEVSPGLVKTNPDKDLDGNDLGTETKVIRTSVLHIKAVKALQEAMARIETLEQRLTDAGL